MFADRESKMGPVVGEVAVGVDAVWFGQVSGDELHHGCELRLRRVLDIGYRR